MPLLQKITRPTVRILGTEYSSRVVGLHNRLRAHASRLLVYKAITRLRGPGASLARGAFVPGSRRLVVYLRPGAPELTVAHELVHALLYTEGFLPMRCRTEDLRAHPAIGALAQRLNDLLVHPVVLDRLRRAGFDPGAATPSDGLPDGRHDHADGLGGAAPAGEDEALAALARAVGAAEAASRLGGLPGEGGRHESRGSPLGLRALARSIVRSAPWNPGRTPLDARVRAAALVRRLGEFARGAWGEDLRLNERIMMPAYLTRRRLVASARSLFEVGIGGRRDEVVIVRFRPDGAPCSARTFADPARASRVAARVAAETQEMSSAQFVERHRLEYLLIEGGRRYRPRAGGAARAMV